MEPFVSLSCVLGFIGFINSRFVHSRAPWRRWVHPWSVGSTPYALGVVWFIRGHWVHYTLRSRSVHLWSLARALGSVWFIWECSVHSRAPWRSMGSLAHAPGVAGFAYTLRGLSWVFGFARARPGDRWVHLGSMGSLTRPGCRRVRPRAPVGSLGSSAVILFTRSRLWGRWVHPG